MNKVIPEKKIEDYLPKHMLGVCYLPRTEFLLHAVKKIEKQLLDWYKENHCKNGDSYNVRITKKGKWAVSHSNDYPLQHGSGKEHILTEEEFSEATKAGWREF